MNNAPYFTPEVITSEKVGGTFYGHFYGDVTGGTITGTIVASSADSLSIGGLLNVSTAAASTEYDLTAGADADTSFIIKRSVGDTTLYVGDQSNVGSTRIIFDFTDAGATQRNWFIEGYQTDGDLWMGSGFGLGTGTAYALFDNTIGAFGAFSNFAVVNEDATGTSSLQLNYQVSSAPENWNLYATGAELQFRYNNSWTLGGTALLTITSSAITVPTPMTIGPSTSATLQETFTDGTTQRWTINHDTDTLLKIGYQSTLAGSITNMMQFDYSNNEIILSPGAVVRMRTPSSRNMEFLADIEGSSNVFIHQHRGNADLRLNFSPEDGIVHLRYPNTSVERTFTLISNGSSGVYISHRWHWLASATGDHSTEIGWQSGNSSFSPSISWFLFSSNLTPDAGDPTGTQPTSWTTEFPTAQMTFSALTNTDGRLLSRCTVMYGNATEATNGNATLSAADIFTGYLLRSTATSPSDTLPTGSALDAILNSTYDQPNGNDNQQNSPNMYLVFENIMGTTWTINPNTNAVLDNGVTGSIAINTGDTSVFRMVRRSNGIWTFNQLF